MWNPTNPNIESDNKKVEQVGAGAVSCSSDVGNTATPLNQQQQQNFNNFGNIISKKEQQQYDDSCCDSGFCSGALTSKSEIDSTELKQSNIPTTPQQQQKPQQPTQNQIEETVLDSGCIVSDIVADDDDNDDYVEAPKQVSSQTSNATVAGNANVAATDNQQMIIKHKVDSNCSEWFCKLSLETDQTNENSTTVGLNNLNARANNQSNRQQQQSSQQPTQHQQQQQPTTTVNLNPSNAWERFYQQNDEGDNHLHVACALGDEEIVAALIRMVPHPCLFNIQNDEGQTALHIAARAKQPKILRMLLIAGAEPLVRDCRGNIALHLACESGDMQCVNALIMTIAPSEINQAHRQYGHRSTDNKESSLKCAQLPTDLELRNYDGLRCVHIAAQHGYLDILCTLESFGADMNAKEGLSGYTPLHIAIINNNEEIINFLLNDCRNLNIEAETYAGRTAYQIADALEKYQMTNILRERGAEPLTPPDSEYETSDIESDDEKESDWFAEHQLRTSFTLMVA